LAHAARDRQKRQLAQAIEDFQRGVQKLSEINEEYKPYHPELSEGLEMGIAGGMEIVELLLKWWETAWGKRPSNLDSWIGRTPNRERG